MTIPFIWPPCFHSHFILAKTKAQSVIFFFLPEKPLYSGYPANAARFLWPASDCTNRFLSCMTLPFSYLSLSSPFYTLTCKLYCNLGWIHQICQFLWCTIIRMSCLIASRSAILMWIFLKEHSRTKVSQSPRINLLQLLSTLPHPPPNSLLFSSFQNPLAMIFILGIKNCHHSLTVHIHAYISCTSQTCQSYWLIVSKICLQYLKYVWNILLNSTMSVL